MLLESPSTPSWRTTPFRLSEAINSIHSQLPSILVSAVHLRHRQPKKASHHADEDRLVEEFHVVCARVLHMQSAFFFSDFNQNKNALTNFTTTHNIK